MPKFILELFICLYIFLKKKKNKKIYICCSIRIFFFFWIFSVEILATILDFKPSLSSNQTYTTYYYHTHMSFQLQHLLYWLDVDPISRRPFCFSVCFFFFLFLFLVCGNIIMMHTQGERQGINNLRPSLVKGEEVVAWHSTCTFLWPTG